MQILSLLSGDAGPENNEPPGPGESQNGGAKPDTNRKLTVCKKLHHIKIFKIPLSQ